MTKAEAIAMLKRIQEPEAWEPQINQAAFEALDMAIEALSQESSEDVISRQAAIDAYIMKCPYFAGKNTIDRSNIGTHIGSCDLEHHYRKVCPSNECLCAERLGLKNG